MTSLKILSHIPSTKAFSAAEKWMLEVLSFSCIFLGRFLFVKIVVPNRVRSHRIDWKNNELARKQKTELRLNARFPRAERLLCENPSMISFVLWLRSTVHTPAACSYAFVIKIITLVTYNCRWLVIRRKKKTENLQLNFQFTSFTGLEVALWIVNLEKISL